MYFRFACIFSILFLTHTCFGQYAKNDHLNYLADHAVFFGNGVRSYQENGKYGFIYKDIRLSKPIYDTVYSFGTTVCIAKRDSVYLLLDQNLKSKFSQAIRSIDKYYSPEKNAFVMTVQSTRGFSFEYTTNSSSSWQAQFTGDSYRNPLYFDPYNRINDSIKSANPFPEATGPINWMYLNRPGEVSPYEKVLYDCNLLKFFPKEGKPFIRNRTGLAIPEFPLGASLIEYQDYSDNKYVVIDEEKEDTILRSKFQFYSFIIDEQLYIFNQAYDDQHNTDSITVYNQQGKMLGVFVPQTIREKKCRAWVNGSVILEELPPKSKKDAHYPLYTIYSAANLERILENVIHYDQEKDYILYYSPSKRNFYLAKGNRILYSFVTGKKQYVGFDVIKSESFGNDLISVTIRDIKEHVIESTLISSSGKVLDKSIGNKFQFGLSTDGNAIGVHEKNSIDHRFAIFLPEADSLHQFVSKDNLDHAFSKEVLYYSDDDGDRLETIGGKTLLTIGKKELKFIRLKGNDFVVALQKGDSSSLYDYDSHFQLLCDQCTLAPIRDEYPVFTLRKNLNEPVFELVDEHLNPISTKRYFAFLKGKEGSTIALLTEHYEIEYLDLNERKRY